MRARSWSVTLRSLISCMRARRWAMPSSAGSDSDKDADAAFRAMAGLLAKMEGAAGALESEGSRMG
jgi:hypothetical protein